MVDYLKAAGKGSWGGDARGQAQMAPDMTGANSYGAASRPSGKGTWGSSLSGLLPWIGGAAGIASMVGGMFFGKTSNQPNAVSTQSVTEPDPTIDYNQDSQISGAENSLTYKVTGVSNQLNKWGTFNTVFGEKVKFYPSQGMQTYGSDGYLIGCLDLGYGELVIDPADFAVGERPLSDFAGMLTEIQYGRPDDVPFVTSLAASSSENMNIPLGMADGWKTVRIGKAGTSMGGTVNFPFGLWARNIYYPDVYELYNVTFAFQYKKTTSNTWLTGASLSVTENTFTGFSRSVSWTISEVGEYDIRVSRTGGGEVAPYGVISTCEARANLTYLYAFYDAPDPPFKDVFDSKGNLVRVPRILFKIPNTVEGAAVQDYFSCKPSRKLRHWDGTQWVAPAVSSLPPDEVLEVLQGQGAFEQVDDVNIDLDSFKEWSDFCYQNELTYRKNIDQGVKTQDLIDEIAAAGRANVVNINGKYTAIVDKPRPNVTQHFSLRSIIKDSFTAQASLGESPQVIFAQFLNPEKDWQQDEIEVYDDGFDVNNKTLVPQTILFPGCTNAIEAHKRARYLMACTRLQFWTYTFRVATSHLACKIGDRVRVTHDAIFAGLGQGRISRLITNEDGDLIAIRIDAPQEIEAGKTYGIKTMSGNKELNFELNNTVGEYQELTLADPLSAEAEYWPVKGNQVLFGEVDFEALDCLITEIVPAEDFTAQLTLIPYNEGCYTAYNETIPAYVSRISTKVGIDRTVGMPTLLSLDSGSAALESLGGGRFASGILLTLVAETLPITFYETWCKLSSLPDIDVNWEMALHGAESGKARISNVIDGEYYDVKVRNRTADNYVSAWNYAATNHQIVGQKQVPPDVPSLVQRLANTKIVKWYYDEAHGVTVPADHGGFRVKLLYSNTSDWLHGLLVADHLMATQFDFTGLASGVKTIMIKAIDYQGNEQAGPPAFIITDLGDIEVGNVVDQVDLSPSYAGVAINNHVMTSRTELNWFPVNLSDPWITDVNAEFFPLGYVPNADGSVSAEETSLPFFPVPISSPMFPANLSAPWQTIHFNPLIAEFSIQAPLDMLYPNKLKLVYDFSGSFTIEYRKRESMPFFPSNLALPWFPSNLNDSWMPLDNLTWLPYDDAGIPLDSSEDGLIFDFRISGAGGGIKSVIKSLGYFWDVPDKTDYINDFIVDDLNGKEITLIQSFRAIKHVSTTLEMTPEYPTARNALSEGKASGRPKVKVFDGVGNPAMGKVDVIVKGY